MSAMAVYGRPTYGAKTSNHCGVRPRLPAWYAQLFTKSIHLCINIPRKLDHISPLPIEILVMLFKLAAEPVVSILRLSLVSRRFRAVAVHTL